MSDTATTSLLLEQQKLQRQAEEHHSQALREIEGFDKTLTTIRSTVTSRYYFLTQEKLDCLKKVIKGLITTNTWMKDFLIATSFEHEPSHAPDPLEAKVLNPETDRKLSSGNNPIAYVVSLLLLAQSPLIKTLKDNDLKTLLKAIHKSTQYLDASIICLKEFVHKKEQLPLYKAHRTRPQNPEQAKSSSTAPDTPSSRCCIS
jgi:hypothetical protein